MGTAIPVAWTPGPWHVSPDPTFVGVFAVAVAGERWDEEVAERIEAEADARLIALAPEMAEALRLGARLDDDEACNHYQGGPCRRTDTKPCMGCVSVWAVKDAAAKVRQIGGDA